METDFPPTVINVDLPAERPTASAVLPWVTQASLSTAWRTALEMSLSAEQIAAEFRGHSAARAVRFALLAELLAVGSVAVALLPLLAVVFPRAAVRALYNPAFAGTIAAEGVTGVVLMAALMVALHGFWAWGMELGVRNRGLMRNWSSGMALAFYSCGWDLVTSPFGVLALLFTKGPRGVAAPLQAALRAPRLCVGAYLHSARGFSANDQRAILTFAVWITAPVVLLLSGALLVGLVAILA